ncbi:MAG: hypothetical protein JST54_06790 [Deltaproteobacteria bacterium]|nr:hypothetical protein [Deltaproteobacteria bacterium]
MARKLLWEFAILKEPTVEAATSAALAKRIVSQAGFELLAGSHNENVHVRLEAETPARTDFSLTW